VSGLSRALLVAAATGAVVCLSPAASASDEKAFAELKAKYEKAAKNHDDKGIRERRILLTDFFDFLDQKACRKFLHDVLDGEDAADLRIVCVQVLGASGDPKDLESIVKTVAKDKVRGPAIAIAEGLDLTATETAPAQAVRAAELALKAKGDARFALLEGVARIGDAGSYDALVALGDKLTPEDRFIRDVALGACGKEKAVATLTGDLRSPDPVIRLGAATGLAKTGASSARPALVDCLKDSDARVVEEAAKALGEAKHDAAKTALADALVLAPLRVKWTIRGALTAIVGKDYGLDAAAWRAAIEGKPGAVVASDQPASPQFFGIPVVSDRVAVLLDCSRRMTHHDRFASAKAGVVAFLQALDKSTSFDVYLPVKVLEAFSPTLTSGAAARDQAAAWVQGLLTGRGNDLKQAFEKILTEQPDVDTICIATSGSPAGYTAEDTAMEVIETFRRANLIRRVRLHVAFVVPGGRATTSETEDEFADRPFLLKLLAETASSGGKFVQIEK
jgi:hypothetical protein